MRTDSPHGPDRYRAEPRAIGFGLVPAERFEMGELDALLTGAGGAIGVAGWVIWWQSRLIESLRNDLRALAESARSDQVLVYDRMLTVIYQLNSSLTGLEKAVARRASGGRRHGDGANGNTDHSRD